MLFVAILCAAALLRLWRLDSVPPGLTHDEAAHGQDAISILHGARPVYETVGYGREPLYDYVVALAMAASGQTGYLILRLVSVLFGLLVIITTYLWVRRAYGLWEAVLACAWLSGSFWSVTASRQGLRSIALPGLLTAAVYAWWRGAFDLDGRGRATWAWFALSGLLVGATLWTYMAARVTWALFLVLPFYLLLTDQMRFRRRWPGMSLALIVAALSAAPMFLWLQRHPEAEQRFSQLGEPLRLLATGDLRQVWRNTLEALGMFVLRGDNLWIYNLPGRPWLGPVTGALFFGGVVVACWRWRRPQNALALMWLVAGVFPSMVTGVEASATRAIAALPVLYLFPAIALVAVMRWVGSHWRRVLRILVPVAALLVVAAGLHTYRDYFDVWADAPEVRVAYHTTLFEIAHHLDQQASAPDTTVVLSSIYPGRFHDPYALDLMLSRDDLSLRWTDGRAALVFPASPSRLIVPTLASLDPALQGAVAPPHAQLVEARRLHSDDLNPGFDVYEWDSPSALADLLAEAGAGAVAWSEEAVFPASDPHGVYQRLDLPADLGHVVALVGYQLSAPVVAPGGEVTLTTYWRVLASPDPDLDMVLFTHLLALDGAQPPVIAQQDHLDAPAWNWHPGETFAQVHRLSVEDELAAGAYPLEVGAFTRPLPSPAEPDPPTTRLRLYVEGRAVSDRVLLPPLQVGGHSDP